MDYQLLLDNKEKSIFTNLNNKSLKPTNKDLVKIYNYFLHKGYYNIVSIQIINLITTIFLIFMLLVLTYCVDYHGLIELKSGESYLYNYVNLNNLARHDGFYIICLLIFFFYCVVRMSSILSDIKNYKKVKDYLNNINISDQRIGSIKWQKIIDILEREHGEDYNAFNINMRILKKDNIMIDLFNTKISKFLYMGLMEWNISYCIINILFDDNYNIKDDVFNNEDKVIHDIHRNLITISILTYIFMPFIMIYMMVFSLLKYGEKFYNNPERIFSRQWSIRAKWKHRYFNEMKHEVNERLDISSRYARDYCNQFNSKVIETISKFAIFIASAFFIIFLLFSLINEHLLLNLNITESRPILWYMGILGSIIALGKNINKERRRNEITENYDKLISSMKYLETNNQNEINKDINQLKKIKKNFEYQFFTLMKECLLIITLPFALIYICNYVEPIVKYIKNGLERDSNLGIINKKSNYKRINTNTDIKIIISFKEFKEKYNWGQNIEDFILNSNINYKNYESLTCGESDINMESNLSLII